MMHPMIHLNGSGADNLRETLCDASGALQDAFDALKRAAPNGRDYYTLGADAMERARTEHDDRLRRLDAIREEIDALAMGLDDYPEGGVH